jgi:hypothetical protein
MFSEVVFADSHGKVTSFSLDKHTANGNFSGPTGSILSLDILKSYGKSGMLACVGLDRFLRLFDMSSRACLSKVFCKTKMTSVLILGGSFVAEEEPETSSKRKAGEENLSAKSGDHESDALWNQLPRADNPGDSAKRRRLRAPVSLSNED